MAALRAENARLQAQLDAKNRTLADMDRTLRTAQFQSSSAEPLVFPSDRAAAAAAAAAALAVPARQPQQYHHHHHHYHHQQHQGPCLPEYLRSRRSTVRSSAPPQLRDLSPAETLRPASRAEAAPPADQKLLAGPRNHIERNHIERCKWRGVQVDPEATRYSCFRCRKNHDKCNFTKDAKCGCCEKCRTTGVKGGPNPGLWQLIPCHMTSVFDLCEPLVLCVDTQVSPHKLEAMKSYQDRLRCPSYQSHEGLSAEVLAGLNVPASSWWIPQRTSEFGDGLLPDVIKAAFDFESRQNADSPLVLVSLLCLRDCQTCLSGDSLLLSHNGCCEGETCGVSRVQDLATHLAMYLKVLDAMFKRDLKTISPAQFLSMMYSLVIMAYVQRALRIMEDRFLRPERPHYGASLDYLGRVIALFGAMEKEDTLWGVKKMSPMKCFEILRRGSASDRAVARAILARRWTDLGIHTTAQFLQRHMEVVCRAEYTVPARNLPPRPPMDPARLSSPIFGSYDADTASTLHAPSLTDASMSPDMTPFQTPLLAASNYISQLPFGGGQMDTSLAGLPPTHAHDVGMDFDLDPFAQQGYGAQLGYPDTKEGGGGGIDADYDWQSEVIPWASGWDFPRNNA